MTNEDATNETMDTYPAHVYGSSPRDEFDNQENVVRRSVVDDYAERYPSPVPAPAPQPVSMYARDSRYEPIPVRHMPKKTDPSVYYIDSRHDPPDQANEPVVFLHPHVISQPVLYNIVGPRVAPTPMEPSPRPPEPPSPVLYSLNGRPRTVDMATNTPMMDHNPTVYSLVGSPRFRDEVHEPSPQHLKPAPQVYSVIGNPARTSRGVQADTSPTRPSPVLYTIVGETPPASSMRTKELHVPPGLRDTTTTTYLLDNEANVRREQAQQPIATPTLYALVGKQLPPPMEEVRARPPARNRTPPPLTMPVVSPRPSRSLERKPDIITEETISYPIIKTQRQPPPKEPVIAKPELFVIPTYDEDRRARPAPARQPPPVHTYVEPTVRKTHAVVQYPSVQSTENYPANTVRTRKPYREQRYTNVLPVITNSRPERKERPPLYEPRYRVERHHQTSVERYPVNTKPRASIWDHGYQTQTDDDEDYEQRLNRKNRMYKTARPRAPWIPVW